MGAERRILGSSLAFAYVVLGCAGEAIDEARLIVTRTDSAGVELVSIQGSVRNLPEWRLSSEPIAVVGGEAEPFLTRVGEIAIREDGGFWVDENESAGLYLFEADASGFRQVGREGDGPGEFRNLTALTLGVGDTVFAYDRRLYRITVLGADGEFVRSLQVGRLFGGPRTLTLDAWGFDSDRLLLLSDVPVDTLDTRSPRRDYTHADLYPLDRKGGARGDPTRFSGGYTLYSDTGGGVAHFAPWPIVAVGPGFVVWGSGDEYELTVASPLLETRRVIRWPGWREPLGDSLLQVTRKAAELRMEPFRQLRPDLVASILRDSFDPATLPDTLPALGQAVVDDRGRIWVAKFRPGTEPWNQADAWHVLAEDGNPAARLLLPAESQLKAVRGDLVAIVARDEFEVEHVRIHRLIDEYER